MPTGALWLVVGLCLETSMVGYSLCHGTSMVVGLCHQTYMVVYWSLQTGLLPCHQSSMVVYWCAPLELYGCYWCVLLELYGFLLVFANRAL